MRTVETSLVAKIVAVLLALSVLVFVAVGGLSPAPGAVAPASARPAGSASASASAASAAPSASATAPRLDDDARFGIIGPATKADPHAIRRAVRSLVPSAAPSAPAP